jgi:lysophospholipase L1-like esterase
MTTPHPLRALANLKAGRRQTIVLYGTSLTHGGAWASALAGWFDGKFPGLATVINSGGPGENSDWGLANVATKVATHQPDLVILEFSYNDAHEKFTTMTPARALENLDRIIAAIRAAQPAADIVLQVMNEPWDAANAARSRSSRPLFADYNENYRRYAAEHRLPLLDHSIAWRRVSETDRQQFEQWIPDGTHPTIEGSLAVTWPGLREFLENAAGLE